MGPSSVLRRSAPGRSVSPWRSQDASTVCVCTVTVAGRREVRIDSWVDLVGKVGVVWAGVGGVGNTARCSSVSGQPRVAGSGPAVTCRCAVIDIRAV